MNERYELLLAAYAARDTLALQLGGIALGIVAARGLIAAKSPRWLLTAWDAYMLLGWIGILFFVL
jgi:hypothetical protein